ncbi:MAG: hypothetical protein EPO32_06235 [Anaerolineae bacterium]|nr:MAG: hypothetical protein EPO32_06235 [Anaerolineae bacterium]
MTDDAPTSTGPDEVRIPAEPGVIDVPVGRGRSVRLRVDTPADTEMHITLEREPLGDWLRRSLSVAGSQSLALGERILRYWPLPLDATLFIGALLVYASVRLIGLTQYPIYFFTDEALQTNLAGEFLKYNFHSPQGELFPTYFRVFNTWNLNVSVYLQLIPYVLVGKSVFWTRATVALTTVLGAFWVGRMLKDNFKIPFWWVGVLVFSLIPVWFLHSRTAFETPLMAVFYIGFLYYYLCYRQGDVRKVYAAVAFGSLAFYTYSAGKLIVPVLGIFLLLSDLKYHWQQRKTLLKAAVVLVLFILPLVRFTLAHPEAQAEQLGNLTSVLMQPIPWTEKASLYFKNYLFALSPGYLFIPNNFDLVRHQMGPLPQIMTWMLPFYFIGIALCIANFRNAAYRVVLFGLLAVPSSPALVTIGATRVLSLVGPAAVLITLGLVAVLNYFQGRAPRFPAWVTAVLLFVFLASANFRLLGRALTEGPTWSEDYSLGGMQYGGIQLFERIREYHEANPDIEISVTPNWSNGTGELAGFFFDVPWPFTLADPFMFIDDSNADLSHYMIIALPNEYERILESPKVKDIRVIDLLEYPNGEPGFYFLTMEHAGSAAELIELEIELRQTPVEEQVEVDGEVWTVRHTPTDMGQLKDLFDNNPDTVARTGGGNPFIIEVFFPDVRTLSGVELITGSHNAEIIVQVFQPGEAEPQSYLLAHQGSISDPIALIEFEEPVEIDHILISVRDVGLGEPANIHVWQIEFLSE